MKIRDRIKELRRVKGSELLPNPKNWRQHPDNQADAMRGILAEVGFADASLAYETSDGLMLVDGHLRSEIAPDAEIPVLVLDVTPEEADKILATHDAVTGLAEMDNDKFADLMSTVSMKSEAAQQMLDDMKPFEWEEVEDDENTPGIDERAQLVDKWGTCDGQVWDIKGKSYVHKLAIGSSNDCGVLGLLFGDNKFRVAVTSPPYNQNVGQFSKSGMHAEQGKGWIDNVNTGAYDDNLPEDDYMSWQIEAINLWGTFASDDASLFYNHKNRFRNKSLIAPYRWLEKTVATIRQEVIWKRPGSVTQNARMFMPCDERIFWLYWGEDFYFKDTTDIKSYSTVWEINPHIDRETSLHGCAFPIEIPSRVIKACSDIGDIVFEPYCGSGTTMAAAEQLNRKCYACELSKEYAACILERMEKLHCTSALASEVTL